MEIQATGQFGFIVGLILAALGAAGAFYYYLRETDSLTGGWIMAGLRSLAVALLLLMFIEPVVHTTQTIGRKGKVLIFADRSNSMSLEDPNFSPGDRLRLMLSHELIEKNQLDPALIDGDRKLESIHERLRQAREKPANQPDYEEVAGETSTALETVAEHVKELREESLSSVRVASRDGAIRYELWEDLSGDGDDLKVLLDHDAYPDEPDRTRTLSEFSRPEDLEHYGTRTYGYVRPPSDGTYRFELITDDAGRLNLSTDRDRSNKRTIVTVPDHIDQLNAWQKAKTSDPIQLEKGKRYYIEVLHTQGEGPSHVQVGWRRPDGSTDRPIPGKYLATPDFDPSTAQVKNEMVETLESELIEKARALARNAGENRSAVRLTDDLNDLVEKLSTFRDRFDSIFDGYASRLFSDETEDEGVSEAVEKLNELKEMSRWERVRSILTGEDRILGELTDEHDVELWGINAGEAERLRKFEEEDDGEATGAASGDRKNDAEESLDQLQPDAPKTNLTSALEKTLMVRSEQNKKTVAMLLTDGQHNEGDSPISAAGVLRHREIPVYSIGIGSTVSPADLGIIEVESPETVFYKNKLSGRIRLKDRIKADEDVKLTIRHGDDPLWSETYTPSDRGQEEIEYSFSVEELVERLRDKEDDQLRPSRILSFTARVDAPEDDSHEANNARTFHSAVVTRSRKLLLIDGRPRWEFRYIRNFFKRDSQWEVEHLLTNPFYEEEAKKKIPTEEEKLKRYDLVVFGDVPPETVEEEQLTWIRKFTTERGGGLIFIDGARNHLKKYEDTPLETLIPVKWKTGEEENRKDGEEQEEQQEQQEQEEQPIPEHVRLTETGHGTSAFQIGSNREETEKKMKEFPPPHWTASVEPHPGAETYMEAKFKNRTRPLAVARYQGAGRVLYMGTDEFWRWRFREADEYHRTFWQQIVPWTAEEPFMVRNDAMALGTDKPVYEENEKVGIRARLFMEDLPETVRAVVKKETDDGEEGAKERIQTVELRKIEDRRGLYRGETASLERGSYQLDLNVEELEEDRELTQKIRVTDPVNREFTFLKQNKDLLTEISDTSGGTYFREDRAKEVISKLDPISNEKTLRRDIVVWQSWWFFLPVVLLLTAEWICRKWYGLI